MISVCKNCRAEQEIDISNIKGKVVRYSCEKCNTQNLFVLPSKVIQEQQLLEGKIKISGISIRTKITLIIVALVIVSISAVGYIASNQGAKALAKQARANLQLVTTQKATEYNSIFGRLQDELEGVAMFAEQTFARPTLQEDLHQAVLMPWTGSGYGSEEMKTKFSFEILALQRVNMMLKGIVENNPYIDLGYMATANDVMILNNESTVDVIASRDAYIPSKRAWFTDAVSANKTIWTAPYIDVVTKKLIVSCATPVFNKQKQLLGVVGFDVSLDTIQQDIISLDIGYDSQAFLVGKEGNLLAKPEMEEVNANWDEAVETDNLLETSNEDLKATVNKMINMESGVSSYTVSGNRSIVSFAPLTAINASVGITVSEAAVMKPALDIQKLIITVWAVVVVLAILIGYTIGSGITKPINEIIGRANLISQGKTDLDLMTTKRKDEIGVLVEAFNRLISSLKIAMSIDK